MWILGLKGLKGGEVTTTTVTVFWRFFLHTSLPLSREGWRVPPPQPAR